MGAAGLGLLGGLWAGLLRLGWNLPWLQPNLALAHGPLMVCGFLGTLIGVERAVALGERWSYLAPTCTAVGAVLLSVGWPDGLARLLFLAGSIVLIGVFSALARRQPTLFLFTMLTGSVTWAVGNALWVAGVPIPDLVQWWVAFLVLTIVGERLELSRFLPAAPTRQISFRLAVAAYLAGLLTQSLAGVGWSPLLGAGLVALALWLARYDIARVTIRHQGLPRFSAACLLAGYVWLAVSGAVTAGFGRWPANVTLGYDAMLHSVFLGFVFSMIFAHAPIIFPAISSLAIPYRPAFYFPLALLEASVLWRVGGDCLSRPGAPFAAGMLNVIAILLFFALIAYTVMTHRSAS